MHRGRWAWCACTPRSGTLIRTRLECWDLRLAGIERWRSARILHIVCTRLWMLPSTSFRSARNVLGQSISIRPILFWHLNEVDEHILLAKLHSLMEAVGEF